MRQALCWVQETQQWMLFSKVVLISVKWLPRLTHYKLSVNGNYASHHHLEEQTFRFGCKLNAAKHTAPWVKMWTPQHC